MTLNTVLVIIIGASFCSGLELGIWAQQTTELERNRFSSRMWTLLNVVLATVNYMAWNRGWW